MKAILAPICTIIMGVIGGLLGSFIGLRDGGTICAIATMGGFIISAIED